MLKFFVLMMTILALVLPLGAQDIEVHDLDLEYDAQQQWNWLVVNFNNANGIYGRTKRAWNKEAGMSRGDNDPVDIILRRTQALLEDIKAMGPTKDLVPLEEKLAALKKEIAAAPKAEWAKGKRLMPGKRDIKEENADIVKNKDARFPLFKKVYMLQREIAFANPLLDFDKILFIKRNPAAYSHMVDQYFGIAQHPGGGLYVLEDAFTDTVKVRNVLANSTVENGRLKGKKLVPGSFLTPEMSYDGETIIFAFTELEKIWTKEDDGKFKWSYQRSDWTPQTTFHVFTVNADGSNLRMLTDGPFNDFDPCFIPNGRIAFISERRGGQGRCHPGRMCTSYVLHSMLPDGTDIVPLSYHETNEWSPTINNQGEIVYSRWDYVDRDVTAGEYPWVTKPDGRDARAIHGNYSQARFGQTEFDAMAIPNTDSLYVATVSMHHNQSYGSFALFDASVWDYVDEERALKYFTPDVSGRHGDGIYATPWPLGENYVLGVFSPLAPGYWNGHDRKDGPPYETPVKHGVYLIDAFGNKILLYRDKNISTHNPMPFRSRPTPPRIPHMTAYAYPPDMQDSEEQPDAMSRVAVMDVYQSLFEWPEERKIESLRIVQLYPKPTIGQDRPHIGYASMMNARKSLGTVPVEEDGSVHFIMPPKIPVYFQALDKDGLAIQSMKSAVYTHPGEMLSCQGCHEPRNEQPAGKQAKMPMAMKRQPSELQPDINGDDPIIFARLVQPVLDAKCVECHTKHEKAPGLGSKTRRSWSWSEAYKNLEPYAWYVSGRKDKYDWDAGKRSVPGQNGAYVSKLYKMLTTGSHKDKVKLTEKEMDRLTLWMDLNSPYFGAYRDTGDQSQAELVIPVLE